MSRKHDMWTHASSVQIENRAWEAQALRRGRWTRVTPSGDDNWGWFHFAIPTPVMVDNVPLKAQSALIRFSAGPQASIVHFQVWNASEEPAIFDKVVNFTSTGKPQNFPVPLEYRPELIAGVGISIKVNFTRRDSDAWIELIGAGIRFSP